MNEDVRVVIGYELWRLTPETLIFSWQVTPEHDTGWPGIDPRDPMIPQGYPNGYEWRRYDPDGTVQRHQPEGLKLTIPPDFSGTVYWLE